MREEGRGRRVLVTGGAGFVGSHLVRALLRDECFVVGVDAFTRDYDVEIKKRAVKPFLSHPRFRFVQGDIRDALMLRSLFADEEIDEVYHLAAKVGVRESIDAEEEYMDVNVEGTRTLLLEMARADVHRLLFTSSSSVYGRSTSFPSEEDHPLSPISPYAKSKLQAEHLCQEHQRKGGVDARIVRLFTVYGPGVRPNMAISRFVEKTIGHQPLTILGDGSAERDFTYISDVIRGMCLVMSAAEPYLMTNIGSGQKTSITSLIRLIAEATGLNPIVEYRAEHQLDVPTTHADIQKASVLGYRPSVQIREGIQRYVDWVQQKVSV